MKAEVKINWKIDNNGLTNLNVDCFKNNNRSI